MILYDPDFTVPARRVDLLARPRVAELTGAAFDVA